MQLVKMELRGFKSFADKTTLTFDQGITAIVGPNGSGKSNISDALRWVLGEQNVRQLRGQKAEDIIFAGTTIRRPLGVAEVSLYFDNSEHVLDIDFTEVVVTRRLFRSGDSEFLLNKKACRLKDIHALFADTGIGQDSMAVIGQNRVDRILNSKPEERRIIFEEVAGITRFKSRKEEGLRKLADTARNLERVGDLRAILEDRLAPLKMERDNLVRFRALDKERLAYEGSLTLQALRNSEGLLEKAERSREVVQQEIEHGQQLIAEVETQRQSVLQQIAGDTEQAKKLDQQVLQVHNDWESLKERKEACIQRQAILVEQMKEIEEEKQTFAHRKEVYAKRVAAQKQQMVQRQRALQSAKQGLALLQGALGEAEVKEQALAQALGQQRNKRIQYEQEKELLARDLVHLQQQIEALGKDKEEASTAWQSGCQEQERLQQSYDAWVEKEKKLYDRSVQLQAAVQIKENLLRKSQQQYDKVYERYKKIQQVLVEKTQRVHVLQSMEEAFEGVGRAGKVVFAAEKEPWHQSLCGMVGRLCYIPSAYVTAIDIALGNAATFIIINNEGDARQAIAYLQKQKAGRTTFLPLDRIQPRHPSNVELAAVKEEGIIGFAHELLTYDERYAAVFSSLLGKTIVASSVDMAAKVARKYGQRLRMVCLDGTLFHPGGAMTGGSMGRQEGSLVRRHALVCSLEQTCNTLRTEGEMVEANVSQQAQALATIRSQYEDIQQAQDVCERQLHDISLQRMHAEKDRQLLQARTHDLQQRYEKIDQERRTVQAMVVAKEEALHQLIDFSEEDGDDLQHQRKEVLAAIQQYRQDLTESQVAVATLEEQIKQGERQGVEAVQRQHDLKADEARLGIRYEQGKKQLEETVQILQDCTVTIARKEQEVQEKDKEKEQFYRIRQGHFEQSSAYDAQLAELRLHVQEWEERLHRSEMKIEKYSAEIRHFEALLARQGFTRQQAMEQKKEGSLQALQQRVQVLQQQLATLGVVNPNAEEAYQTALAQQKFYDRQCEDLEVSRQQLQHLIKDIDAAMALQFSQAFDAIGKHFQTIFSRLFGGGMAQLVLSDEKEVLQSGVDMLISPPGKKKQALSLLSGGERALTVIALLLAFLAYHPAPFCFVDEVDAALDEANVERLAQYLQKYTDKTQFIVITHRRKTMEAAKTLQGITMEEKGVSRLVSIKIDDIMKEGI